MVHPTNKQTKNPGGAASRACLRFCLRSSMRCLSFFFLQALQSERLAFLFFPNCSNVFNFLQHLQPNDYAHHFQNAFDNTDNDVIKVIDHSLAVDDDDEDKENEDDDNYSSDQEQMDDAAIYQD